MIFTLCVYMCVSLCVFVCVYLCVCVVKRGIACVVASWDDMAQLLYFLLIGILGPIEIK